MEGRSYLKQGPCSHLPHMARLRGESGGGVGEKQVGQRNPVQTTPRARSLLGSRPAPQLSWLAQVKVPVREPAPCHLHPTGPEVTKGLDSAIYPCCLFFLLLFYFIHSFLMSKSSISEHFQSNNSIPWIQGRILCITLNMHHDPDYNGV